MRRTKTLLSTTAAVVLMVGALFSAPASAAPGSSSASAAVECAGWGFRNADDKSGRTEVGANLKVGPYTECGNVVWVPADTLVYYWCYVSNEYGNTWSFVRIAGTQTHGWIYDGHLPLNPNGTRGATAYC
jgi:hypothetical protein